MSDQVDGVDGTLEKRELRARSGRGSPFWSAEALLLLVGSIAAVAILEGIVRVAAYEQNPKGGYSPVRGHRAREPENAAGYRDVEHKKAKPPGVRRAIFVGDSFTYGAGVMFDDVYGKRTERGLSLARSETWESIVMAVPGIGTEEEATIIRNEALGYSPDLVVLGYVLNDAELPGAAEGRRAVEGVENAGMERGWWSGSALLSFLAARLHATVENRKRIQNHLALYGDEAPGFRAAKKSLEDIAARCRERGVPFLVVLFPLFANPLDDRYPFGSIHAKMEGFCHSRGIAVVDLLPYYRGMDWRLLVVEGENDEHPNELAHRIAAQALLAALATPPALLAESGSGKPTLASTR